MIIEANVWIIDMRMCSKCRVAGNLYVYCMYDQIGVYVSIYRHSCKHTLECRCVCVQEYMHTLDVVNMRNVMVG